MGIFYPWKKLSLSGDLVSRVAGPRGVDGGWPRDEGPDEQSFF
jgi:hypothetical protein